MCTTRRLAAIASLAAATLPAAAAEGAGLGEALIKPQLGTFVWTLFTFLLMLWVLGRYAWRPLLRALDAREQGIRESIDQARRDREEAHSLLGEQRELIAEARRERALAVEAGRADAEKLRAEILADAERARLQTLQQAEAQIGTALRQAQSELRGLTVDLAIRAAEKLLARNLDAPTQRGLVEDYLADLERADERKSRPS